jgi:hypothetical protein
MPANHRADTLATMVHPTPTADPPGDAGGSGGQGPLRRRVELSPVAAVVGRYGDPCPECGDGRYLLCSRDQFVTLAGAGYFVVRWEIEPWKGGGTVAMPAFSGLAGTLIHVASGGGHRMDDQVPGGVVGQTWFGVPGREVAALPPGTPMIWQHEFYHLDGTVTYTNRERTDHQNAFYSLSVGPVAYAAVRDDINHPVRPGTYWLRPGIAHDR